MQKTQTDDTLNTIDTSKAFANLMAFKFPESDNIWFRCSIKLCIQSHSHLKILNNEQANKIICYDKSAVNYFFFF